MVAVALMRLARAGRLDLDAPVTTYLEEPQFAREPADSQRCAGFR